MDEGGKWEWFYFSLYRCNNKLTDFILVLVSQFLLATTWKSVNKKQALDAGCHGCWLI